MATGVGDSTLARARDLHTRAVGQMNGGQPGLAVRTLRGALELLDEHADQDQAALVGRIWLTTAYAESELRGLAASRRSLAEAERIAVEQPGPALRILVSTQRGVMFLRAGRNAEALHALDEAVALAAADGDGDPRDRANLMLTRGTAHLYQGEYVAARRDFEAAIALTSAGGLRLEEYKARHNLGYLEFLLGDLPAALRDMDAAAALGDDLPRSIPLLDRARVLIEAGLVREADDALAEAGELFAAERLAQDVGEVELARAECALLSDDVTAARTFAARARSRFARRGNERWMRRAELVVLRADVARGRTGPAVAAAGRRLVDELLAEDLVGQARIAAFTTAEALLDRARVDEARVVADAIGPAGSADPITARLHTRYLRARLAQAGGDAIGLRRQVRAGLRELADYQSRFGSIDLQTASAIHGRHLAELGLGAALAAGRPADVFAASEQGRAASSRLSVAGPPADDDAVELLAELRRVVEAQHAEGSDPTLRRRRRRLERRIKARSWTLPGGGPVAAPARFAELRAAAAATGSVIVDYLRVAGRLHALVVDQHRVRVPVLGAASAVDALVARVRGDLDVLAYDRVPAGIRLVAEESVRRALAELDAQLLAPLQLSADRVVVVPTGSLGALPWGLLPSLGGVPVAVAPSGSAWLAALGPGAAEPGPVVAVAGPDLDRAAHEVEALARSWAAGRSLVGSAGTRTALRGALAEATVVHVAAHGRHQAENPLFSSVQLADGPLFAYELERAAPHVILSACELGLATIRPGDEALGLANVLLHVGTRSVVAGVARVHDEVAADVMVRYHRELAAGRDSAEALAVAAGDSSQAVAPFVCFGAAWWYPTDSHG